MSFAIVRRKVIENLLNFGFADFSAAGNHRFHHRLPGGAVAARSGDDFDGVAPGAALALQRQLTGPGGQRFRKRGGIAIGFRYDRRRRRSIAKSESDISQLSKTAQDAVERANSAGKLAQGKLVYEVVLSDDKLKFGQNKSSLSKEAEAALDEFAARLKGDNKSVFIEIQGHTDSIGEAAHNLRLGEARAEAVRRHLNMKAGIPLHRMAVISYGETSPVADNKVKAGRQQNRRVVLVVIQ